MIMEARKYGRNEDGEDNQGVRGTEPTLEQTASANATPGPSTESSAGAAPAAEDTSGGGFDYSQNVSTTRYNVQVRIGPNGEMIIDEESLFVDRNAEEDTTEYTHLEESDATKFVNSGTYAKRFRGSRWSAEETELFYDVSLIQPPMRSCVDSLPRRYLNLEKTTNSYHMSCPGGIAKPVKTSSRRKTRKTQRGSISA